VTRTPREVLRAACEAAPLEEVRAALAGFLAEAPGIAAAQFAAARLAPAADRLALPETRLALLASFTIEPLAPHLTVGAFQAGRRLATRTVTYEQWFAALSTPGPLDAFAPDLALLLLHLEDICPLLARRHLAAGTTALDEEADRAIGALEEALDGFRRRSTAPVALSTFIAAERGIERHFDRRVEPSRQGRIDDLNRRLGDLARAHANAYVFDYAQTVTDFGRTRWFDPLKNHHVRAPLTPAALPVLAAEITGFLDALERPRKKVMAIDLDNTLWAGVVGEDGSDGIAASGDYPGNAHGDFQAFLANLRASGVALAAVSKNNEADAHEAFEANPDMPLGWDDFAARRIDWNDKAANLRAVAEELALGTDAILFADDSPMECDLVRRFAPDVAVVHLDGPPSLFPRKIAETGAFDAVALTEEDRARAASYGAERARKALAGSTDTRGFLAGLNLRLTLRSPRDGEIERVAQLFAKTNQFNLTTRRYSTADVLALRDDPAAELLVARLADRYGDYGLVGVAVTRDGPDGAREIDSLLMSCRVLGRGVEEAILAEIETRARGAGRMRLIGRYLPSRKNGMVADLYPRFGFAEAAEAGVFERDLGALPPLPYPQHTAIARE
jgi:FkbH-like protein